MVGSSKINLEQLTLSSDSPRFELGFFNLIVKDIIVKDPKCGPDGSKITLKAQLPYYSDISRVELPEPWEIDSGVEGIFKWLTGHGVVRDCGKSVPGTKSTIRGLLILVYISCDCKFNINDPLVTILASAAAVQLIVDDLLESLQVFEMDGQTGKIIADAFVNVLKGKSLEDIEATNIASFPALEPALAAFKDLEAKQAAANRKFFSIESESYLTYINSTIHMQQEKKNIYAYPENTFLFLRSLDVAAHASVEIFGNTLNLTLPEALKTCVLYQRAAQVMTYLTGELNDLVGIKKDLMDQDGLAPNILIFYTINQNLTLEEAWKKGIELVYSHSKELLFLFNKILDSFPQEEGLEEFLETNLRVLDMAGYYLHKHMAHRYLITE